MKDGPGLVEVAVDAPVKHTLTYVLPPALVKSATIGKRVIVPLGRRKVTGYIIGFPEKSSLPETSLKKAISIIDQTPLFSPALLTLFDWAARYYFSNLSEVIKTALPAGINVASRRMIEITDAGRLAIEQADAKTPKDETTSQKLKTPELDFLNALSIKGQVERKKAGKALGVKVTLGMIKRLLDQALIEESDELSRTRVGDKKERALAPERDLTPEEMEGLKRRAPEQARLMSELMKRGASTIKDLKQNFKDPSRLGRALASAGLSRAIEVVVSRDPFSLELPVGPAPKRLMPEQKKAIDAINTAQDKGEFQTFLVHGVTGSGKTEVYLRVIDRTVANKKCAIMLVPEIALTPQLISRFRQRFDDDLIAVLHSGLSSGERHDQWWRIKRGEAKIVIGARSAVFAPVAELGVIVVDEEQDPAYKQDHGFMYNGRDLSLVRARDEGAVAVLGSATPSMESAWKSRQEAGYTLLTLPRRVDNRPMPEIEIVDLGKANEGQKEKEPESRSERMVRDRDRMAALELISEPLRRGVNDTLSRGEQAIIFLNRRGIFSFLICFDCGQRFTCPNCAVSLVRHRSRGPKVDTFYGEPSSDGFLLCHHCGYHSPLPEVCPRCRGVRVHPFGVGTEQMEQAITETFPGARVLRMDSDVMTGKKKYFECMDMISRKQIDIVVGTQMVAKGHDLPGVTLVGVILADLSLNIPDFRASERTFHMLTQVAGRAGRGSAAGRVIIQTFEPGHYAVEFALKHNFEEFYKEELRTREALFYPPFARLANLRIAGINPQNVQKAAGVMGRAAKSKAVTKAYKDRVRILGPVPAPIKRIRGKTRWMMMVKADSPGTMSGFLDSLVNAIEKKGLPGSLNIEVDRDPVFLM